MVPSTLFILKLPILLLGPVDRFVQRFATAQGREKRIRESCVVFSERQSRKRDGGLKPGKAGNRRCTSYRRVSFFSFCVLDWSARS